MNANNILIAFTMAVIITVLYIIYKNMVESENNTRQNLLNNKLLENNISNISSPSPSPTMTLTEGFQDNNNNNNNSNKNNNNTSGDSNLKSENEQLKKYMKIHGLYPQNHGVDMSKYVLKSSVKSDTQCPDMSQYVLKTSIPPPQRCPTINRDDWIRKTELPPNWNKECPQHPDLTNYVLKSTIPPKQDCPACICPKVKVNAGLCRKPTKEECLKNTDVINACPKPKPCPELKCPPQKVIEPDPKIYIKRSELPVGWNKECPPKEECPELKCAPCPEPKKPGDCPAPERCAPSEKCPKCYDVKYVKVPVVKSEPLPKPNKETIFPTNIIETKLVRQQMPEKPRQPRVLRMDRNNRNNRNSNNNYYEVENDNSLNNNQSNYIEKDPKNDLKSFKNRFFNLSLFMMKWSNKFVYISLLLISAIALTKQAWA